MTDPCELKKEILGPTEFVQRASIARYANVVPSLQMLVNLIMEVIRSSETSVVTNTTRRNIPEDGFLELKLSKKFGKKNIFIWEADN
jgi:hypothetical protein